MGKKRQAITILFAIIVLLALSQMNISCTVPINSDKLFLNELDSFVTLMQMGTASEQEPMRLVGQLEYFSKKYPDSRFADDAQFIVVTLALAGRWNSSLKKDFLKKYSTGSLENETKMKLEQVFGVDVYFPYTIYFENVEVSEDIRRKDFVAAKSKLMDVLQAVDQGNPKLMVLRSSILKVISACNAPLETK